MSDDRIKYPNYILRRMRYRQRREGETLADYNDRMAKAHSYMSDLMRRTRRPWEYD